MQIFVQSKPAEKRAEALLIPLRQDEMLATNLADIAKLVGCSVEILQADFKAEAKEVFQNGSMANNQCRIYQSTTSITPSGNTVTLSVDVEFLLPLSSGNRIIYGAASVPSGVTSGWQTMGTTGIQ